MIQVHVLRFKYEHPTNRQLQKGDQMKWGFFLLTLLLT